MRERYRGNTKLQPQGTVLKTAGLLAGLGHVLGVLAFRVMKRELPPSHPSSLSEKQQAYMQRTNGLPSLRQ